MTVSGVRHAEPPLRLTRRGRVVLLGLFLVTSFMASVILFTSATQG
ncbi:MAG TPA: hypothetical protein VN408_11220 [Actinoplanes sp.]|nr:hypothetical protein [Actinoplanes sp.]